MALGVTGGSGFRRAATALCGAGALLAGYQAYSTRQTMNADGVSYLDMGDAFLRGDLHNAVNAYWSPLYAFVLGVANRLVRPPMALQYPLVHAVNFLIFLGAMAAFGWFLWTVVDVRRPAGRGGEPLPPWLVALFGFSLFLFAALALVSLELVTPDMLVAAFVFLAAGLLERMRQGDLRFRIVAGFGLALGFGYLAKAPLFPVGFLFIAGAWIAAGKGARWRVAGGALAAFLLVAGPWIAALSFAKKRPTFGDAGKLNYAWYVSGVTFRHWQGEDPATGRPVHPTRRVVSEPPVYAYDGPVGGTCPAWYDPSYWYEGARVRFDRHKQTKRTMTNLRFYYGVLANPRAPRIFGDPLLALLFSPASAAVLLGLCAAGRSRLAARLRERLPLLCPAVGGLGMFFLVYSEPRHIAPFLVLLAVTVLTSVSIPEGESRTRALLFSGTALGAAFTLFVVVPEIVRYAQLSRERPEIPAIAEGMFRLGLAPGQRVASLDYGTTHAPWARLDRVQVVAEVFRGVHQDNARLFWDADASTRERVLEAFRSRGAAFVVTRSAPSRPGEKGWVRVGASNVFALPLARPAIADAAVR